MKPFHETAIDTALILRSLADSYVTLIKTFGSQTLKSMDNGTDPSQMLNPDVKQKPFTHFCI